MTREVPDLRRGQVVVCLVAGGEEPMRTLTLDHLRAQTPNDVPIVALEAGEDPFTTTAPADVVVVEPGCIVAAGWLEGLRGAAAGSTVATASALTQHDLGSACEPVGWTAAFEGTAAAIRSGSLRLRPRLPAAGGPCRYVRRSALELIVDRGDSFMRRCVEHGLAHVLADDVLVLDARPGQPPAPATTLGDRAPTGPLAHSLRAARRALQGLSAVIDAGILHGPTTGTHVHVVELIAALARTGAVRLTVMLPDHPSAYALERLGSLPGVALVTYEEASRPGVARADVAHRPFQINNAGDLSLLASLGERLVLTQQDLIAFHNPAYFPSDEAWEGYRELTRLGLGTADRVVFSSEHAREDALAEGLVAPARVSVVRLGVDHPLAPGAPGRASTAPAGAARFADGGPAMLCLSADFHHKNRLFALRMLEQLRGRHGWNGALLFAGPSVAHGSSRAQEARLLSAHPELSEVVHDFGAVTEDEKEWLFTHATLVVYPSVLEGFGLVPFEAAARRVPCMWAAGSSLSDLLPDAAAAIVRWDAEQSAQRALALMQDDQAREANLRAIDAAASGLTWDATAAGLLEVYRATADAPSSAIRAGSLDLLSEDAARLVGPRGELPPDVYRPLLALATHRRIAAPVFGALKLGYRATYELRRRRTAHRRK